MDNILFENPLARMYGPTFLVLYFLLFVMAAVYVAFYLPKRTGKILNDEVPVLPAQPDVYELAYLRGGNTEVMALLVYTLMKRQYIIIADSKTHIMMKQGKIKELAGLSQMERDAYELLKEEMPVSDFATKIMRDGWFKTHCESLRKSVENQQLIWGDDEVRNFTLSKTVIIAALVVFGLYKLVAASVHGHHNVFFLIVFGIGGSIFLYHLKPAQQHTSKGMNFISGFKNAFKPMDGEKLLKQPVYLQQVLLGLYGFSLLSSSSLYHFHNFVTGHLIQPRLTGWGTSGDGSSSSCSSGCGSSCGGGCGGGCGGCS